MLVANRLGSTLAPTIESPCRKGVRWRKPCAATTEVSDVIFDIVPHGTRLRDGRADGTFPRAKLNGDSRAVRCSYGLSSSFVK